MMNDANLQSGNSEPSPARGVSLTVQRIKSLGDWALLGLSVAVGILIMLGIGGYSRLTRPADVVAKPLASNIWVTEQIKLESIPRLADAYTHVIDMRPDGEAADEPSSDAVGAAVRANHMDFSYVPVPHGDIPESAVAALANQLATTKGPVLLYCRSGKRAARTWSLVEASRPGGLSITEIEAAVKASGQPIDDLDDTIKKRIAGRPNAPGV